MNLPAAYLPVGLDPALFNPPGDYVVRGVREYDHFAEEARRVID